MTRGRSASGPVATCRLASDSDRAAVSSLRRSLGVPGDADAWVAERLRGDREFPARQALFVADVAERVVGYAVVQSFSWKGDSPANGAPPGFYLAGTFVESGCRRRGAGLALVKARLRWISTRSRMAYYYADDDNAASIAMHEKVGFRALMTDFAHPWVRDPASMMTLYVLDDLAPPPVC